MVEVASYSDKGGRDYNEDSVAVFEGEDRVCVIVADGLGGHGGGKTASETASGLMARAFANSPDPVDEQWLNEIFDSANQAVLYHQTARCRMKTTCVALFIRDGGAWWAHAGDSRLYHFVDGALEFCTMDHSVSQMAVLSGEITRAQIRFHEDRTKVLRALGADEDIKADIDYAPVFDGRFHAFLLCSDGFWEYVLEGEMEIDLSKAQTPGEWIGYMTERLEKKVSGKNDNYTAAAVFVIPDEADDGR